MFDQAGRPEYGEVGKIFKKTGTFQTELNNNLVSVRGLFSNGASFAADGNVVASDSTFLRLFPQRKPDQIEVGLINLKPGTDIQKLKAQLKIGLNPDPNKPFVEVGTTEDFAQKEKNYWATSTGIGFIFGLGVAVGFIVGIVIVYQILYSDVF